MIRTIKWLLGEIRFNLDSSEKIDFEKGFLLPLSIIGIVFSAVSIVVNTFLEFNFELYIIPFVSLAFFILIYYLGQIERFVTPAKWIFIITVLIATNFVWYYNYGSQSYWFYLLVLLYSYLIFMMSGRQLAIVSLVFFTNVVAMFIYEFTHPTALGDYINHQTRIIDTYSAMLLFGISAYILMSLTKRYYLKEYNKARESDQLKSSFLSNLTHEIRTPLNAIIGFSEVLAEGEVSREDKLLYKSIIENSSDSLLQLIDDALDASIIEAGQMTVETAEFCVNDLITKLETTYRKEFNETGRSAVEIKGEVPKEKVFITSDETRVSQTLVKLIDNAFKFTDKGFVAFGFKREEDKLHFYVSDTGIGIEDEYKEKIFTRFFKVENQNVTLYRGAGLGLYLTKRNVELLNGTIWVDSKVGAGSTFHFMLPASNIRIVAHKEERQTQPKVNTLYEISKLLIVEDDPAGMTLLSQIVKPFVTQLFKAGKGKEAVDIFKENKNIDMVLLDIQLPDSDGFEVLRQLRYINPKVKVIAQTAYVSEKDKNMCYEAGFDGYIAKPIDNKKLLEMINKLLKAT